MFWRTVSYYFNRFPTTTTATCTATYDCVLLPLSWEDTQDRTQKGGPGQDPEANASCPVLSSPVPSRSPLSLPVGPPQPQSGRRGSEEKRRKETEESKESREKGDERAREKERERERERERPAKRKRKIKRKIERQR